MKLKTSSGDKSTNSFPCLLVPFSMAPPSIIHSLKSHLITAARILNSKSYTQSIMGVKLSWQRARSLFCLLFSPEWVNSDAINYHDGEVKMKGKIFFPPVVCSIIRNNCAIKSAKWMRRYFQKILLFPSIHSMKSVD